MAIKDFIYDGIRLSDFGYILCSFDSSGMETVSSVPLEWQRVSLYNGEYQPVINHQYSSYLTTTFCICKDPCNKSGQEDLNISINDIRRLNRWLNQSNFKKFIPLGYEYDDIYFMGSFNINEIKLGENVVGLELTFETNRPWGCTDYTYSNNVIQGGNLDIYDDSDGNDYTYINASIACNSGGQLKITNVQEKRDMVIDNCSRGETITINHPMIESSNGRNLMDDFNFNFLRVLNGTRNTFTFSLSCSVTINYTKMIKVGVV